MRSRYYKVSRQTREFQLGKRRVLTWKYDWIIVQDFSRIESDRKAEEVVDMEFYKTVNHVVDANDFLLRTLCHVVSIDFHALKILDKSENVKSLRNSFLFISFDDNFCWDKFLERNLLHSARWIFLETKRIYFFSKLSSVRRSIIFDRVIIQVRI